MAQADGDVYLLYEATGLYLTSARHREDGRLSPVTPPRPPPMAGTGEGADEEEDENEEKINFEDQSAEAGDLPQEGENEGVPCMAGY